ncbi:hypothetical protein KSP39_PZI004863 [Platanthera zijinensis]|uniref:RVP_2 domain-containing protein n=1 Tax=Platanthera zijinensis TaxID=2320716 RepID=A0AAP0GD80_9ASPA
MEGCNAPLTMRMTGRVRQERVTILVDSGSTHNFIHSEVAQRVGHEVDRATTFHVMVADGSKLQCEVVMKGVELQIQGYSGRTDVYLLLIRGSDMVLGVQWIQQLRRVTFDWEQMTMEFLQQGRQYCLGVLKSSSLKEISLRSLERLGEQGSTITMIMAVTEAPGAPPAVPEQMQTLLAQYADIFQTPRTLPPPWFRDHQIQLKTGTEPINIRSYWYSYSQKAKIECSVRKMITAGLIHPSTSAF